MIRLCNYRPSTGEEPLPYAVALTEAEAMEATRSRTRDRLLQSLAALGAAGVFLPDTDRPARWVRHPTGPRRRMYLFALPDKEAVRRAARAARWDERHGTGPETRWADPTRRY